jgi:hypothetical protein
MRRLIPILLALPGVGCAYAQDRFRDFADVWRVEVSAGVGLQADVAVGEVAHLGLGSSRRWSAGLRYGEVIGERRVEDHLPLSLLWWAAEPDASGVHQLRLGDATHSQHRCDAIVPGELLSGTLEKDPIHYWDIEVRAFVGVAGVEVGFSPGQFVDFLLGWFGIDIGNDDGPDRETRRYWRPLVEDDFKKREPPAERPPPATRP